MSIYKRITYNTYIHSYIHTSCSAPFMIKTRPMVHFSVSTEVKQLIKNSAN